MSAPSEMVNSTDLRRQKTILSAEVTVLDDVAKNNNQVSNMPLVHAEATNRIASNAEQPSIPLQRTVISNTDQLNDQNLDTNLRLDSNDEKLRTQSLKEQVRKMNDHAKILQQTLHLILVKFGQFESNLKGLEREQIN